jgi:hypothetical protein
MPDVFELTFTVRSIGRQPAQKLSAALQTLCQGNRDLFYAGAETNPYTGEVSATSELGEELARQAGESSPAATASEASE